MNKIIKPEEFAQTFTPNLPAHMKKANNEWSVMMFNMTTDGGALVSPDDSFPILTKTDDGWSYVGKAPKKSSKSTIDPFIIFGEVDKNGEARFPEEDLKLLDKPQKKFVLGCRKIFRKTTRKDKQFIGAFVVVMFRTPDDFMATMMPDVDHDEPRQEVQDVFDASFVDPHGPLADKYGVAK